MNAKPAWFGTGACEHFGNAERVIGPFSRAVQTQTTVDFFDHLETLAGEFDATIGQAITGCGHAELKRGSEDNTSVVIRVVPEDLDAAWSKGGCGHSGTIIPLGLRLAKRALCVSMRNRRKTMSDTHENNTAAKKLESSSEHAKKAIDAATEAGRVVGETVKKHAKAAYDAGREHLGAAAKDLGEAANAGYDDFREQARHKAEELRGRAQSAYQDASARAQSYQSDAEAYIRENPLQSVGIALGVGFVLGLILRR